MCNSANAKKDTCSESSCFNTICVLNLPNENKCPPDTAASNDGVDCTGSLDTVMVEDDVVLDDEVLVTSITRTKIINSTSSSYTNIK